MTTRRNFIKTAVAASVGTTALAQGGGAAAAANAAMPRQAPRGLTLLAMIQPDGAETLGVKLAGGVLDVAKAGAALKMDAPTTLEELLVLGQAGALEKLINAAKDRKDFIREEADIKFGRMFSKPGKIVCVGLNYREHVEEAGEKLPKEPILFNKYNNTLASHNCTIKLPPRDVSYKFDYETELLVVTARRRATSPKPRPSTMSRAMRSATISPPATCSSRRAASGWSAKRSTASPRSDPISCRPI
jgi:hypothetical protein